MKVFQDMVRLTPAPTVGREATVFFLTMTVLAICAYLAIDSVNNTLVFVLVGVLAVYAVVRMVYRLLNPDGQC
ncbi:TPA: hypothetical protein JAJ60_001995 [Corynebacterium striatum]|uniref:Uncharacterized protein n=1 Tax=Corynebacterium striatum TaxID=43770 RepID=A0AAQ1Z8M6_CORST|nr:hypothetical protein [Corynebacterium striatum]EEI77779.1 hypothetical protein HMPREF0308_2033 [Corynebacterium striatum ATCC 6940]PIS62791.1 hypothetical protein AZH44_05090 [Corynebacterium striatum]PXY07731.1 hypothetical protein CKF55_07235 [Corynebacterium striatum]PXY12332.1 hypothetical protein CKF62_13265 [Corynebacterium striatum]PXY13699.1 hypothetical protein CKF74_05850 [Corynebacterium striatum]